MGRFRIALTFVGLGVLVLLGSIPPAAAVFPGQPGILVFSSEGNIFTIAPDGSPPLSQLTFDGQSDHPRWSPSGDRIAFDRAGDIYVMSPTGGNVRRLTNLGLSSEPAWAPSGQRIVFVHRPSIGAAGDLWVVPLSGGAPWRLTFQNNISCHIGHLDWSPLGGRIAYEWQPTSVESGCSTTRVVVMKIDPRERRVIPFASDPDFTADGKGLFFASAWDPEGDFFWPGDNLSWSGLFGGRRARLTSLLCAEGDPCFISGGGSPASAFPGVTSYIYTFSRLGGTLCVATNDGDGFCSNEIPVRPFEVDWQPVPAGS